MRASSANEVSLGQEVKVVVAWSGRQEWDDYNYSYGGSYEGRTGIVNEFDAGDARPFRVHFSDGDYVWCSVVETVSDSNPIPASAFSYAELSFTQALAVFKVLQDYGVKVDVGK